jgi:hypothetical protein
LQPFVTDIGMVRELKGKDKSAGKVDRDENDDHPEVSLFFPLPALFCGPVCSLCRF